MTKKEIFQFRPQFAAIVSASGEKDEPYAYAIASFGGNEHDRLYFKGIVWLESQEKKIVADTIGRFPATDYILVAQFREDAVQPNALDVMHLGEITGGAYSKPKLCGKSPNERIVDVIDFILVNAGGAWNSVIYDTGLAAKVVCPHCGLADLTGQHALIDKPEEADVYQNIGTHALDCPWLRSLHNFDDAVTGDSADSEEDAA